MKIHLALGYLVMVSAFLGEFASAPAAQAKVLNGIRCKVTGVQGSVMSLSLALGSIIVIDNKELETGDTYRYDSTFAKIGNYNFTTLKGDDIREISPGEQNFDSHLYVLRPRGWAGRILDISYAAYTGWPGIHGATLSTSVSVNDVTTDYQVLATLDCGLANPQK